MKRNLVIIIILVIIAIGGYSGLKFLKDKSTKTGGEEAQETLEKENKNVMEPDKKQGAESDIQKGKQRIGITKAPEFWIESCGSLPDLARKDQCFLDVAEDYIDEDFCEHLSTAQLKKECQKKVGEKYKELEKSREGLELTGRMTDEMCVELMAYLMWSVHFTSEGNLTESAAISEKAEKLYEKYGVTGDDFEVVCNADLSPEFMERVGKKMEKLGFTAE